MKEQIFVVFQNLGTLVLLAIAFPFNCIVVLTSLLLNFLKQPFGKSIVVNPNSKNILIAGARMTKTLQLARSFHAAGHRVIIIDIEKFWPSGNKYSNSVAGFYTVPDPSKDLEGYVETLHAIAKKEKIDFFIPVAIFSVIHYDHGKPPLPDDVEFFHFDADLTKILDDKFAFAETARSFGLSVPKSFKITDPEQVINFDFSQEKRKYILKSIPYDQIRRLNLTKLPCDTQAETAAFVKSLPISEKNPWIMQEFIPGKEYCTHTTARDGESRMYCCCESSAFQVNYENVDQPEIMQWANHFTKELGKTGQLSFDFIQVEDGTVYAIECNPRTHSAITMFYNHPGVADAYLGKEPLAESLQPLADSKPTYWLYHEVWRLNEIRSFKQLQTWVRNILRGKEAIFEVSDPLPFLLVHHWQIPLLILDNLRRLKGWIRIDFNMGELIE
ncbi:ATP-grasp domain-containing protein [Brasilonema bromeliae]|uniref:ATP-grasp enzyme n=1 Tax=Brasilonema bromeliae SPC951 TaxID=385972 RepID=A0ABX1PDF7_9CYAN|nr:ATP-grasp domain-containing protein [Brasilonema bromeliae]NMG21601.1 ATP-grasp enzyme [Brasilonema bromeliae SPC951]